MKNPYQLSLLSVGSTEWKDSSRWLMQILGAAFALGIAVALGARPAIQKVYSWRSGRLMDRAENLAREKKWDQAGPLLKSAMQFTPNNLRCFRLAAEVLALSRSPQALTYYQQLAISGTSTYAERRSFAALAAELSRPDLCNPTLAQLFKENPKDSELFRIQLALARRLGLVEQRAIYGQRWLQIEPDAAEPRFEVGSHFWKSTDRKQRQEGHRLLWGLAWEQNSYALSAVAALARETHLASSDAKLLERRLAELAPTNRFLAAEIRVRLRPSEMGEIVRGLKSQLDVNTPVPEVTESVRWLSDHKRLEDALELMTPERVRKSSTLQVVRLETLISLGRLGEVSTALESPLTNAPAYLQHCLRATLAQANGVRENVVGHLEQAITAGNHDPNALLAVARFAEAYNQPRCALVCWRKLAEEFDGGLDAALRVSRLSRQVDDLAAGQSTLNALRQQMSGDVGAALVAGYVDGMVGNLQPEALNQLREIARTNPPSANVVGVLALAEWKNGDVGTALKAMESSGLDWLGSEPRFRALYTGLLAATGQSEAARRVARSVPLQQLVSEERRLVEPWL